MTGGRDLTDQGLVYRALYDRPVTAVVHGRCRTGADTFASRWARDNGVPEILVPAQWDFYKKTAGPLRNGWMIEFIPIGVVLAFPGGPGTANMVKRARAAGLRVKEIEA